MNVIGLQKISDFIRQHTDEVTQLESWVHEAQEADWRSCHDIMLRYPSAHCLAGNRVIFHLNEFRYCLATRVSYNSQIVLVANVEPRI